MAPSCANDPHGPGPLFRAVDGNWQRSLEGRVTARVRHHCSVRYRSTGVSIAWHQRDSNEPPRQEMQDVMTGSNHGWALRRLLGGVSVPLYSLSQIGIHVHDAVAVEHEVAHEVAMAADIAHNRVVGVPVQVLIALLGGVQPEIWNRHPGHEEVDVAWSLVQAVAANRHEIRQRRWPQVTVQRSKDRRKITAGRGQRRVPLFVGVQSQVPSAWRRRRSCRRQVWPATSTFRVLVMKAGPVVNS